MEEVRLKIVQHSALWAAYGDALGFITELADNAGLKRRIKASYVTSAVAWRRLVGGRFGAEIDLPAGCYSDDTQLRLATSRAIRGDGTFDVEAFVKVELPVWLSYALGAGKGSTVAAASLARYDVNWFSNFFDQQKSRYVEGGGNGGAMRIQPHVWAATDKSKPETFISDIVRNVLCTHGHPRGILGAVFHALCLASAFEKHTVPGLEVWKQSINFFPTVASLIRNDSDLSTFWVPTWEGYTRVSIEEAFEEVKKEALLDIEIVQKCILGKPEESYSKLVEIIGGLKNELRGSGMKTAIIAAALSWMYRNEDPAKALITAANLLSSDTDTIATMAGAILGAVADQPPSGEVLDRDYIDSEATRLHSISCHYPTESFVYPDLFKWQPPKNQLDTVGLVDNRLGVAGLAIAEKKGQEYKGRGSSDAVWQWLRLDFGQSVLAKRRTHLKPLPIGNLPAKSILPRSMGTLAAKADAKPEAIPTPREVFDRPRDYWSFLTARVDNDFEGQHFDRKEAGQIYADGGTSKSQVQNIIEHVTACISAFANSNIEGGLLVLGIASNGSVKGVRHLSQHQQNSITDFESLLNNQSSEAKFYDCSDEMGVANRILLIYTSYTERAICETPGRNPKAWTRNGSQNVPLTQATRDRLRQQKRIVDFEMAYCCDFDISDVDQDVLSAFRRVFLSEGVRKFTDEELLCEAGAIIKIDGGYGFTNAGLLFFATNPQRVLSSAYIRLLRFNTISDDMRNRGLPNLDKSFTGPLTKQIRDTRSFFKESGFFKVYQMRRSDGGFKEEPEYPPIAIEEALVNAVTHRDYATALPIECEAYRDAFIVRNPGRMMQRDVDLPEEFSLADRVLNSMPRNPKLLEWLKIMKDPEGKAFVQAIAEGTKTMTDAMSALSLPAPSYRLSDNQTALKLVSNAEAREAALLSVTPAYSTEFANLYPLNIRQGNKPLDRREFQVRYKEFLTTFRDVLRVHGWYIDQFSFSRIVAHRRGALLDIPKAASSILRLYPAYECQVREYSGHQYLCVDYTVQVLNVYSLDKLLSYFPVKDFIDRPCVAKQNGWKEGKILVCDQEWTKVFFSESEDQEQVPSSAVIPRCSLRMLDSLLRKEHVPFDLYQAIKQHSLAAQPAAARMRAEKIASMAEYAVDSLFPITFGDFEVGLNRQPVHLVEHGRATQATLPVRRLAEPMVEFRDQHTSTDVRDGITRFGAYGNKPHTVELVPFCISPHRRHMEQLIERLKVGKYKYRGAERTFAIRFTYSAIVTVECVEAIRQEVERILTEHPDWIGDNSLSRIFLVHTPEQGYAADDESSPYYAIKRLLFEKGIPCQMVDTPTLVDPNWKDLNLALNITAKCGVTPWVLPDAIPDADFFVGLSYTQSQDRQRVLGFANVFNRFGKWEFYSGNMVSFDNEERAENLAKLVRKTLQRLTLSLTPNIIFHYSARFARDDRTAILEAARSVRPQGTYTFVWINSHHNVCFFDSRAESDGSMRRGSYVQTSPHQVFLSTTGYNPFRRAMGTSKPLQINARVYRPEGAPNAEPDMKSLAVQVLSLTKLNWASTDAFCGEPITLKYAGDIAYLTAAFLRESEAFKLHPALEQTPWFL